MHRTLAALISPRVVQPLFWLLTLFTLVMALLPRPPALPIDRFGDKFEHMLAFVVLTGVALLGWRKARWWFVAGCLILLGAQIEVLQALPMLHRDAQLSDWLADSVAVLAGVVLGLAGRRLTAPWAAAPPR